MTEDHAFVNLTGQVEQGRERLRRGWGDYFSLCPGYMLHMSELFVVDQAVVMVGRMTGSHLGLPGREEIPEKLLLVARVAGRRVSEWRLYPDEPANRRALRVRGERVRA